MMSIIRLVCGSLSFGPEPWACAGAGVVVCPCGFGESGVDCPSSSHCPSHNSVVTELDALLAASGALAVVCAGVICPAIGCDAATTGLVTIAGCGAASGAPARARARTGPANTKPATVRQNTPALLPAHRRQILKEELIKEKPSEENNRSAASFDAECPETSHNSDPAPRFAHVSVSNRKTFRLNRLMVAGTRIFLDFSYMAVFNERACFATVSPPLSAASNPNSIENALRLCTE
jgi:hypothetical protein